MLCLTRKVTEKVKIGNDIEITVTGVSGGHVRLAIVAPPSVAVYRSEVCDKPGFSHEKKGEQLLVDVFCQGLIAKLSESCVFWKEILDDNDITTAGRPYTWADCEKLSKMYGRWANDTDAMQHEEIAAVMNNGVGNALSNEGDQHGV